ncbi:antitermination protein Q [Pantoea sp. PNA 14-12]|uniref:antiterminator Q family protein n=1 Tax=Pantoea TaxID=53335 RepID=UPI00105CBB48|nr:MULTISPECIES: antiterminator Q family protein [Pantoea]NRH22911.1 antitermination protein [Pantoea stewartii]TDS72707.1 antitermination protein Q [Pantoea sp. PNA 14-12]
MRDIQQVLERRGAWSCSGGDNVGYAPIAAGFKGVFPSKQRSRASCTDKDGITIDRCMARLMKNNFDMYDLLVDYYIYRKTFMQLARLHGCSDTYIGKQLQKAEGVVEGMLLMLDIQLEMDPHVEHDGFAKKAS